MDKFDEILSENRLIYQYIRGSHCHGLNTPQSDVDEGGIYLAPIDTLMGLGFDYKEQVSDESNDVVWYELRRFFQLLVKSNPTVLEALFVDDKFVRHEDGIMTIIKDNRDQFLTKKCFSSFFGYAESQIKKARGLKKLINWDIPERKGVLDFVYTFYKQGSTNIQNWLEYRNLKQEYCGLVNIPNMREVYGVYYDWGKFFEEENITFDDIKKAFYQAQYDSIANTAGIVEKLKKETNEEEKKHLEELLSLSHKVNMVKFILEMCVGERAYTDEGKLNELDKWFSSQHPIGYSGIAGENSNQLRLSSVSKGEKPICYVSYNVDGYTKHCIDYKNYKDWEEHRNPVRYESNLKKSYDAKNMCECFRLVHCGIEIARGEGYKVDRSGIDREFLLNIKNHVYEYDELIPMLMNAKDEMNRAMEESTIKDDIDVDFVNSLYLDIIKKRIKGGF